MEYQDDVWDRKDHPGSKRDENLQDRSAGLSETRWLQSGQLRFSSEEQLLYSRHIDDRPPLPIWGCGPDAGTRGTCYTHWLGACQLCITTAKFTTKKKYIRLNIIQCYAPTNDAEEEKKDDIYQQLQAVLDKRGTKDITTLMGNFNAKIGMDNMGNEDIVGAHGLGQMNETGERFADLCGLNQLVIGGSIFPHKRIHKATGISPNHVRHGEPDRLHWPQTTTFIWQQWDLASRDSPTKTTYGQSTVLHCSETRTRKQLSRSAFPAGSSR